MTIQERWDGTFAKLDRSCPAQRADEGSTDYLRRLSRIGRKYIPKAEQMASINFAELPDETVPKFSELMRAAVERNLYRTDNMAPGEMRSVVHSSKTPARGSRMDRPQSFVRTRFMATATAAVSPGSAPRLAAPCGRPLPKRGATRRAAGSSSVFPPCQVGGRNRGRFRLLTGRPIRGGCDRQAPPSGPSRIRPLFRGVQGHDASAQCHIRSGADAVERRRLGEAGEAAPVPSPFAGQLVAARGDPRARPSRGADADRRRQTHRRRAPRVETAARIERRVRATRMERRQR